MSSPRWLLALPLTLAATLGTVRASSVRDDAGMFSAAAVRQAETELNRVERATQVPVTIETVATLNGEEIADVSLERARRASSQGLFLLIAQKEHKLHDRVSRSFTRAIDANRQRTIRRAFETGFQKGDFDAGLLQGVHAIGAELSAARGEQGDLRQAAPPPARGGVPVGRGNPRGGFGLGSLLGIGLLILGVLFVVRLLGALFGGNRGYAGPAGGRMGAPGYGPGGYGGGGGGGGGFMSSLFGGIGGAMAGNWLYDQFSGRHHGEYTDSSAGGDFGSTPQGGDEWGGGSGGGGDWGGGDAGGGGDWGGGGGGDAGGGDW